MKMPISLRLLCVLTLNGLAACDPCSGLLSCNGPQVRYEGWIGQEFQPLPAAGVFVEFIPTGGVGLRDSRLTATTDSTGRFELKGGTKADGVVTGDLVIHPVASLPEVRVTGLELHTSRAEGELRYLGGWPAPHPYLPYLGELYYRGSNVPARAIRVQFRRTGGIATQPDTFSAVTDSTGRFSLSPATSQVGVLTGELLVTPLPPLEPFVIPDIELTAQTKLVPTVLVGRWGIGLHLPYAGLLVWDDTRQPAVGVDVEFHRTGGVAFTPDPYVTRTNQFGTFPLSPTPLTSGEVVGTLIIRPPASYDEVVVPGVKVATTELESSSALIGVWIIPRSDAQ